MKITTIGIDLAKVVFQVHGVDERGKTVLRKQLKRKDVLEFLNQSVQLEPVLAAISDFIDSHGELIEAVRRDLDRGLKNPATGRSGLSAPQVLQKFTSRL